MDGANPIVASVAVVTSAASAFSLGKMFPLSCLGSRVDVNPDYLPYGADRRQDDVERMICARDRDGPGPVQRVRGVLGDEILRLRALGHGVRRARRERG